MHSNDSVRSVRKSMTIGAGVSLAVGEQVNDTPI